MEKYEAYDAILDHLLATKQGHSKHIKQNLALFKDIDPVRIDTMLEEMYQLAPKAFKILPFMGGKPALIANDYTSIFKEDGGFQKLLAEEKFVPVKQRVNFQKSDGTSPLADLHPIVQKVAGDLFENGHFRQAILDTYIALGEAVRRKSGIDQDGVPLMQSVFSQKRPVLLVSDDPDEQLGFMWLFTGAVMGIRNPKAHRLIDQTDPQRTLEWLSFASVLLRVLDESKPTATVQPVSASNSDN